MPVNETSYITYEHFQAWLQKTNICNKIIKKDNEQNILNTNLSWKLLTAIPKWPGSIQCQQITKQLQLITCEITGWPVNKQHNESSSKLPTWAETN